MRKSTLKNSSKWIILKSFTTQEIGKEEDKKTVIYRKLYILFLSQSWVDILFLRIVSWVILGSIINAINSNFLLINLYSVVICIKCQCLVYTDCQLIYLPFLISLITIISSNSFATWIFLLHYIFKLSNILKMCKKNIFPLLLRIFPHDWKE